MRLDSKSFNCTHLVPGSPLSEGTARRVRERTKQGGGKGRVRFSDGRSSGRGERGGWGKAVPQQSWSSVGPTHGTSDAGKGLARSSGLRVSGEGGLTSRFLRTDQEKGDQAKR